MFEAVLGIGAIIIGFWGSIYLLRGKNLLSVEKKEREALSLLSDAEKEAKALLTETNEQVKARQKNLEESDLRREERTKKTEEALKAREASIEKKVERNNEVKLKIASEEESLQGVRGGLQRLKAEYIEKLAKKSQKSAEELKNEAIDETTRELESDNERKLAAIEEDLKENALRTAQKIIYTVQQRLTIPTTTESRSVYIKVPLDQTKGKIVGKEGKNIQEFEKLLDVDVVFNELPQTISISCYHLVRRRLAQKAMEKLVTLAKDITPEVVREVVSWAEKDMDDELYRIGHKCIEKMGIKEVDKELTRIIGRLKFRTSYGQNIMRHSMEVAWVAMMIGYELGLDVEVLRTGAFMHDLGKAIDQEPDVEGTHDVLSKQIMEKYGYSWEEVHAAWTHHDAEPQQTPEAIIVKAADAVSASRPGARRESLDKYVERLQALEGAARSFEGVKNSYAISAGRELRIFVDPNILGDKNTAELATKVAKKIEEEVTYPGVIKVNVIRRTVSTETAK